MKKRYITLIEVMVFACLSSIILSCLFYFITQTMKVEKKIQLTKEHLYAQEYVQLRLNSIFNRLPSSFAPPHDIHKVSLFTKKTSKSSSLALFVFFENAIDPFPDFSGPIFGKLYVNKKKNLILQTWPSSFTEKTSSIVVRKQILLKNVEAMDFSFIYRSKEKEKILFTNAWSEENTSFPLMFKIEFTLTNKKEKIPFAFFITSKDNVIIYDNKTF